MYWTTHLRFALILFGATSLEIPARKKGETKLHKLLKQAKCSHRANIQHKLKWVGDESKIQQDSWVKPAPFINTQLYWIYIKDWQEQIRFLPSLKRVYSYFGFTQRWLSGFLLRLHSFQVTQVVSSKTCGHSFLETVANYSGKYHSHFKIFWIKIMVNISSG